MRPASGLMLPASTLMLPASTLMLPAWTLMRVASDVMRVASDVSEFSNFPDFARFLQHKNEIAAVPHSMDIQCKIRDLVV